MGVGKSCLLQQFTEKRFPEVSMGVFAGMSVGVQDSRTHTHTRTLGLGVQDQPHTIGIEFWTHVVKLMN